MVQIIIVYDNETRHGELKADWGFACVVAVDDRRILFDTGAQGEILLANMNKLGIAPAVVDEVFISHHHWDHTGGLAAFLEKAGKTMKVYVPASFSIALAGAEVVRIDSARKLHDRMFSTGELPGREQALVVATPGGTVIIAGCSHPGVGEILDAAAPYGKPKALIGGLHGFSDFDLLAGLELVCATHCTKHKERIASLFSGKFVPGGVGEVIEL